MTNVFYSSVYFATLTRHIMKYKRISYVYISKAIEYKYQ